MTKEKALKMIDDYLATDCVDAEWRDCLYSIKWLIHHQSELIDALISGHETLQKYHHNETEIAYKNGYEAGVKEFAEALKEKASSGFWEERSYVDTEDIDEVAKELTGGSDK